MVKKNIYEKKILFICHEGSRTGAPIQLLALLNWIKNDTKIDFLILIVKGGDLDPEFKKLAPTLILYPKLPNLFITRFVLKWFYKIMSMKRLKDFLSIGISLVYCNTVSIGELSLKLKRKYNVHVLTHVHELESVIKKSGIKNVRSVKEATDHYLAVSEAVKRNLIESHNIQAKKISVHYESISTTSFELSQENPLLDLKLTGSEFIVGGSGFVDERKGYDLFIETAKKVSFMNHKSNIVFIWIGGFGRGKKENVKRLILKYNLGNRVYFLGEKMDPYSYYRYFNVFFLTSREDPFPLALLENAYMGHPLICFRDSGGAIEFIENDAGISIENFNTEIAAEKILYLEKNRDMITFYGENARKKLLEKYTIEKNGEEYLNIINKYIQKYC